MNTVTSMRRLRSDPRLHKIPPYISLLCIVGGISWLLLLPLNHYSRQTYISENALLPGQVHTYFAGSEQNVFRGYREELRSIADRSVNIRRKVPGIEDAVGGAGNLWVHTISTIFYSVGLPTATQYYEYNSAGIITFGVNTYSVLHAPRGDGTEAIVLVASQHNARGERNVNGVALLLTLARYFKRERLVNIVFKAKANKSQDGLCGQRTLSSSSRRTLIVDPKPGSLPIIQPRTQCQLNLYRSNPGPYKVLSALTCRWTTGSKKLRYLTMALMANYPIWT
jgi:Gaa1-like, GPI transamidase component